MLDSIKSQLVEIINDTTDDVAKTKLQNIVNQINEQPNAIDLDYEYETNKLKEMIKLIAKNDGMVRIINAAKENDRPDIVVEAINSNPEIATYEYDGDPIVVYCVRTIDSPEILDALYKHSQFDTSFIGTYEQSLLMYAAMYGNEKNVRWLLAHGADTTFHNEDVGTVYHYAKPNVIKILIEECPELDVNYHSQFNYTALDINVENGKIDEVKALLTHPKIQITSHTISIACQEKQYNILYLLMTSDKFNKNVIDDTCMNQR